MNSFRSCRRRGLLGHDRLRRVVDDADLREALGRIVFEVRIERRRRRLRAHVADRDGVAVRLRLGGARHADGPAGAADVLDHQRLAERARHMVADQAGDHVGRPAGGKRHDDGDRLVRILGGGRRARERKREQTARDQATCERHFVSSLGERQYVAMMCNARHYYASAGGSPISNGTLFVSRRQAMRRHRSTVPSPHPRDSGTAALNRCA